VNAFRKLLLSLFVLLSSVSVFADVGLIEKSDVGVRIGQRNGSWWIKGDTVCFVRKRYNLGCGKVVETNSQFADIEARDIANEVEPGDRAQTYRELYPENKDIIITPGLAFGFGYYFPTLNVQIKFTENYYVGVMGSYSSSDESSGRQVSSKGFSLSLNHYSDIEPFPGFWWKAGAGAYLLNYTATGTNESGTAPFFFATVGWRAWFAQFLTAGIGLGLQVLPDTIKSAPLQMRSVEPLFTVDFGVRF
jgi:hypothetical protein